VLVREYWDDYLKRKPGATRSQLYHIKSVLKKLQGRFGARFVGELSARDIDREAIPRPEIDYLKAILRTAKRWGYIRAVPDFHMPAKRETIGRRITKAELESILSQASPLHKDAILLCLYTGGLRLSELCKLTTDTVDFERGTATFYRSKSRKPDVVPLTDRAQQILKRRFLECGGRAFKQEPNQLSQLFGKDRKRIRGVKPWRFHDLRHTGGSLLEDEGYERRVIQALLGHATDKMTLRYLHGNLDVKRAALEELGDVISPGTSA
jgi:integrase